MGMDVYGQNPQENADINKFKVYAKYSKMEFDEKWKHLDGDKTKREQYWKEEDQYQNANPGTYFRNNVWWWRPLWDYCHYVAPELIDDELWNEGHHNSGAGLNDKRAKELGILLIKSFENGKFEEFKALNIERNDTGEEGIPDYPFDSENIMEFAEFVMQSGGFKIC
jgi:hypothetical protein